MYKRIFDIQSLASKKSFFLFGPRSTGKSTLLKMVYPKDYIIDLLSSAVFLPLSSRPSILADIVREKKYPPVIIIDEIQKLPFLLDEVHKLIEETPTHFILTGSSARKLKQSGVNLLAGRAWQANLFPLVYKEIENFDIDRYLNFGGLPQVYKSDYPFEELDAYVNTYLKEEIQAEALVQNLVNFSRFLKTASFSNAEQINFTNIANDSGIPANTVRSYFEILQDSFTGFLVPSYQATKIRKTVATAKFYFFDIGIANFLRGIENLSPESSDYGKAFEHFIAMELRAWISYTRSRLELSYWRTKSGTEVDFLVGEFLAIEVKSTKSVQEKHLKGLRALKEENIFKYYIVLSFDSINRETKDGIKCLHWEYFIQALWNDEFQV